MAGFLGNQPSKVPLTSADIADGTITNADIDSVSATKLTGSIADARVPASAVTQHVTGYDDASIRSDILKLALRQAVDGNRVAYNLENSFIDGFEDDTGITTETTVDRDTTGEYVSSIYTSTTTTSSASGLWSGDTGSVTFSGDDITTTAGDKQIYLSGTISGDFELNATIGLSSPSGGALGVFKSDETITNSNDFNNMTNIWYYDKPHMGVSSNAIAYAQTNVQSHTASNGDAYKLERVSGVFKMYIGGTLRHTYTQEDTGDVKILFGWGGVTGNYINDVSWTASSSSVNDACTLISDPQTASSSRTSCSGVIIYEDAEGTATLGTDLKIYFTANNGTNWTEAASYGTATTYSGSKKLVKLGATTVTGGSAIAMKSVWANQSASSGTTKTITASGDAQHSTSENKIGATSLKCDGTGDFLGIDSHADFNFGTSLWTVEFWYKSTVSTLQSLVCIGDWSSSAGPIVIYQSSDGDLGYHTKLSTGVISNETAGAVAIDTGSWVHIAVSRTTSTTIKAFINGTEEAALAETISSGATMEPLGTHGNNSSGKVFHIGRMYEAGSAKTSYDLNGYIDEVRISKTARYTSNFTPSTSAFTADSNTVLLLHSDTSNGSTTFTDSSAVVGKETRLHGWAVNY